jgi:hypothetical protein
VARSTPQQHVGEAAGAGTGVQAVPSLDAKTERSEHVESAGQFVAAPAGIPGVVVHGCHDQRGGRIDLGGRLGRELPCDQHPSGTDELLGMLARTGHTPAHELRIEPP